jgi:cytosine/adenosine deaminase-related metal-dependent hydrolase
VHVHLCEGKTDRQLSGKSPVRRYRRLGLLNEKSIFVHGIDLRASEIEMLAESGATLAINPRSNLNNAVGLPNIKALETSGVHLALGNDGFGASLCAEAQTALGAFSTSARDPSYGWELLNRILFVNNPDIAGWHLKKTLGLIEPGAAADIAIFPYHPPSSLDASNYFGHYLFGFGMVPARDVIVDGKIRLRDGASVGFNPESWAEKARDVFQKVWQQRSL